MYVIPPDASGSDHRGVQEIAVLSVDVVHHTELLRKHGQAARRAIESYQRIVDSALKRYEAPPTPWAGDGRFGTFAGPRRGERAVLAGIKILSEMMVFNLDSSACEMGEPLKVRMGAVAGSVKLGEPIGRVVSLVISDAHKLQKATRAQELAIGDSIYRILPKGVQEVFECMDRTLSSERIYVYRAASRSRQPASADVKAVVLDLEERVRAIRSTCDTSLGKVVDAALLSKLHGEVKQCYEQLRGFRDSCAAIDSNWAPTYLQLLHDAASKLQRLESSIANCLMTWRQRVRFTAEAQNLYGLSFFSMAQDHGYEEMALTELKAKLSQALGEELEREALDPFAGASAHLERLARADEMERMAEFVALGRYDRSVVCENLLARDHDSRRPMVEALWAIGDLVVGEEARTRGGAAPGADGLFGILLADSYWGPRFQVVEHFLGDRQVESEAIRRRFESMRIKATEEDANIVWRAVVLAHPSLQIKYQAAERAPLKALWSAVAYHGISLLSLAVIAKRVEMKEAPNLKKIFFDCVKSRLERKIQEGDEDELTLAGGMVEGFYDSDLFVENPYFKALEALLALFESRVERFGGRIVSLEAKLADRIVRARQTPKKEGSIPCGVEELPPALKRHLAREGSYAEEFAFDTDDRIAIEVEPFLDGERLARVAKSLASGERHLNPVLMGKMAPQKHERLQREVEKLRSAATYAGEALRKEVERKGGPDLRPR